MKKWIGLIILALSIVGIVAISQHQTGMVQAATRVRKIRIRIVPKRNVVVRQYSDAGTLLAKKPLAAHRYVANRVGVLQTSGKFRKGYYLPSLKSWVLARDMRRVHQQGGHYLPPRRPRCPHMW